MRNEHSTYVKPSKTCVQKIRYYYRILNKKSPGKCKPLPKFNGTFLYAKHICVKNFHEDPVSFFSKNMCQIMEKCPLSRC